jgi:hypothetical protein
MRNIASLQKRSNSSSPPWSWSRWLLWNAAYDRRTWNTYTHKDVVRKERTMVETSNYIPEWYDWHLA